MNILKRIAQYIKQYIKPKIIPIETNEIINKNIIVQIPEKYIFDFIIDYNEHYQIIHPDLHSWIKENTNAAISIAYIKDKHKVEISLTPNEYILYKIIWK